MTTIAEVQFDSKVNTQLCHILKSFCRNDQGAVDNFGGKQFFFDEEHTVRVCVSKKKMEIFGHSHDGEKVRNLKVYEKIDTITMHHRTEFATRLINFFQENVMGVNADVMYVTEVVYHWESLRRRMLFLLGKVFADKIIFCCVFDLKNKIMRISIYNNANTRRLLTMPVTPEPRSFERP